MIFQDKLVFLMELTSTSNKQLAKAIMVDPSLISRLRTGARRVPENAEYIESMANYFALRCNTNYQIDALSEIIGKPNLFHVSDNNKISAALVSWLSTEAAISQSQASVFLRAFDKFEISDFENAFVETIESDNLLKGKNLISFHGNEGRCQANLLFDQLVLSSKNVGEIKLLSEGNTDWIWINKDYAYEISNNIKKALSRGSTIIRILPRLTSLTMAFDSVTRWLPLYVTGQVNSYYYPHIRDNVFCRTLYIAPGIAAMFSTSVGEPLECGTTFLTTDPLIVESLDKEYMEYLNMCRPTGTAYNNQSSPELLSKSLYKFFKYPSDCISILSGLSFITVPLDILKDRCTHVPGSDVEKLSICIESFSKNFDQLLENQRYTEVLHLDTLEDIIAGKARFFALLSLMNITAFYTPAEYLCHLENIVKKLNNNKNYHVVLSREIGFGSNVYVNERYLFMTLKEASSFNISTSEYPDIVSSVWEYAVRKTTNGQTDSVNRIEALSEINNLIRQLRKYIKSLDN